MDGGVAFLYAPVGWQRADMGRALYDNEAVFREALDAAATDLGDAAPDLLEALYPTAKGVYDGVLDEARYAPPALFAVEVALDALLRSRGIVPDVVFGHSLGELGAACSGDMKGPNCGPLSRREAARIVARRAVLMAENPLEGGMTAVRASAEACEAAIQATAPECWVAAVNAPLSCVLAGRRAGVARVVARLGAAATRVRATHPDYTPLMEGIGQRLAASVCLGGTRASALDVYSAAAGGRIRAGAMRTGAFWHNHATSPVRFTDALENLARTGVRVFVELGEGMLCGLGRETLAASVADGPAWAVCLEKGGACVFDACVAAATPPPELVQCRVAVLDGAQPVVTVKVPRRATLAQLRVFLERVYGQKLTVLDLATDADLRAACRECGDGVLDLRVRGSGLKRGARARTQTRQKSPKLAPSFFGGKSRPPVTYRAPEGAPAFATAASRVLRDALPLPSLLPEPDFPSDSMGDRFLDAWRYRWGQRLGDLWLYVPLSPDTAVRDVRVEVHTGRLSVEVGGVALYAGKLWNVPETHGVAVDAAAWVVVRHTHAFSEEATPVLQIELHKKKAMWWKAVWDGHPRIEPWEVPGWKVATLGDGYHVSTAGDARAAVF